MRTLLTSNKSFEFTHAKLGCRNSLQRQKTHSFQPCSKRSVGWISTMIIPLARGILWSTSGFETVQKRAIDLPALVNCAAEKDLRSCMTVQFEVLIKINQIYYCFSVILLSPNNPSPDFTLSKIRLAQHGGLLFKIPLFRPVYLSDCYIMDFYPPPESVSPNLPKIRSKCIFDDKILGTT